MSTEITEKKLPIVMKNGMVHWISPDTHLKIQEQLSSQSGHTFLKIRELGRVTINTSEISGVYDMAQYEDMIRIKEGQRQCKWKKWHAKKEECQCAAEFHQRQREALNRAKEAAENREATPEEKVIIRKRIKEIGDSLRASGVIGTGKKTMSKEGLADYKKLTGVDFDPKQPKK